MSEIANLALDVLHMSRNKKFPASEQTPIQLQIGINTGKKIKRHIMRNHHMVYLKYMDTLSPNPTFPKS